jgi:hypothetical protein
MFRCMVWFCHHLNFDVQVSFRAWTLDHPFVGMLLVDCQSVRKCMILLTMASMMCLTNNKAFALTKPKKQVRGIVTRLLYQAEHQTRLMLNRRLGVSPCNIYLIITQCQRLDQQCTHRHASSEEIQECRSYMRVLCSQPALC